MNIHDWGNLPNYENLPGIPARITAQHKERHEIVCQHGITHAKLKTKEYFVDSQDFPTTGDFVMIHYIENGDSQIIATLPRKTFFSRRELGMWDVSEGLSDAFADVECYQKLKEEAVDKAEMLRRKNEWHKSLAKFTRNKNKEVW